MKCSIKGISIRLPLGLDKVEFYKALLEDTSFLTGMSPARQVLHEENQLRPFITEVPSDRWDWKAYYGNPNTDKTKTKAKWGGFIEDVDKFDSLHFHISPWEAELLDPQHRLALETVYHALEDAGINPKSLAGTLAGVFIGSYFDDYAILVARSGLYNEAQTTTGLAQSMVTKRISYLLDVEQVITNFLNKLMHLYNNLKNKFLL